MSASAVGVVPRQDARIIGLVGVGHGFSHFYQLVLPPLFPIMHAVEGWSYLQLGLLVSVLYSVSGIAQLLAGFLVDRVGPRTVLYGGLGLCAAATLLVAVAPGYPALVLLVALIGLGNSVFHPSDYTILSHNVSEGRVGRGFSVHAFGGYVGYGLAPLVMVALATLLGWRTAVGLAGLAGLGYLGLMLAAGHQVLQVESRGADQSGPVGLIEQIALVATPMVVICFLFFCAAAMAQIGLQTFTPAALGALFSTPVAVSNGAVTAFILAVMAGILAGGVLADRTSDHHATAIGCLALPAALLFVPSWVELDATAIWLLFAAAGFGVGLMIPSRDMLVRSIAPRNATGRVFGFVYSGLDVGSALTPIAFGWLLDHGRAPWVFAGLSLCFGIAIVTLILAAVVSRR